MSLVGCLYVDPGWVPPVNRFPEITLPLDSHKPQRLKIATESASIVVAAWDPDDEVVSFVWVVPHDVPHEVHEWQNPNGDYVSRLTVARDPVLDGESITCAVSDQANPRNTVHIQWQVEVL